MHTRVSFSFFAATLAFVLPSQVFAEPSCRGRETMPEHNKTLSLDQSGPYCLVTDLKIDNPSPFQWHGTGRPEVAVEILHNDISLDLQGHKIHAGSASYAVKIRSDYRSHLKNGEMLLPERIMIRNGTIESVAWNAINSGFPAMVIPSDMGDPLEGISLNGKSPQKIDESRKSREKLNALMLHDQTLLRPMTPSDYVSRDITLEHLRIFAHGGIGETGGARLGAVTLQGANTIIRDCIIETDAGTAIWIFGPNALIENNTIIVHGTNRQREADAPIRLIQADGAIIRNNKIVLRDQANRRAISTFDTGPITVENNTFYGLDKPDQVAQAFLGTLNLRESGSRFEPGWKGWFPGVR